MNSRCPIFEIGRGRSLASTSSNTVLISKAAVEIRTKCCSHTKQQAWLGLACLAEGARGDLVVHGVWVEKRITRFHRLVPMRQRAQDQERVTAHHHRLEIGTARKRAGNRAVQQASQPASHQSKQAKQRSKQARGSATHRVKKIK